MSTKFLIDECLPVSLSALAVDAGYPESAHVAHRGMCGWPDHRLMSRIIEEDWTLVTRNSNDFRPVKGSSSKSPCYVGQPLHAGLICLNPPPGSGRTVLQDYFAAALNHMGPGGNLTNQILEIDPAVSANERVMIRLYDFPRDEDT
ncbi:MAG: DUF5615 family PIN-like protein [Magnetovibrionaceae bacterium]